MKFSTVILGSLVALAVAGCASRLQSDDDLQAATAMQLGLSPGEVSISNRSDSGTSTNYWASTRSGRTYSCVRTATMSMLGTVKSSPLCSPTNAKAQAAPQPSNALLDAYRQQQKQK